MAPAARALQIALAAAWLGALGAGGVAHAQEDQPPGPSDPTGRVSPVQVPAGCPNPGLPDVVFVGALVDADVRLGRFQVVQVRAGSIEQFALGGLVDVRFGSDAQPDDPLRFLRRGAEYLIGAKYDPTVQALRSNVREPQPLFGGDDVIAAAETDEDCPVIDDPMQVLNTDGSQVDTGVLKPIGSAKGRVLAAVFVPLAVGLAILFGLTSIRWLFTGVGKGVGSLARPTRPRRPSPATVGPDRPRRPPGRTRAGSPNRGAGAAPPVRRPGARPRSRRAPSAAGTRREAPPRRESGEGR